MAVIAHMVLNIEFNNEALLDANIVHDFFLYCNFDLDSSGVWFSPNKGRIDKFHFIETLNFAKT